MADNTDEWWTASEPEDSTADTATDQPTDSGSTSSDTVEAGTASEWHNITWRDIWNLNKDGKGANIKNPDLIYPGQVLIMPNGLPNYTVVKGDYLSKIAANANANHPEPDPVEVPDDPVDETDDSVEETEANEDDLDSGPVAPPPQPEVEIPHPVMNPLHNFATSTYGISLSVMNKACYRDLINGRIFDNWSPTYSLIASGGAMHSNRSPYFDDDFYFDGLKMTTIIGPSANSRGTNAINISFTIIEPYGITLLDRLMALCSDPSINGKNYLQQPYLLQIDFFGTTDLGEMHSRIPELQKRIPIKFIEMKIKVGVKGTEYAITAVPYNHGALMETTNSTPVNFEIRAKTVGEFFDAVVTDNLQKQISDKDQERTDFKNITDQINEAEASGAMDRVNELTKQYNELKKSINTPYSVSSYAGAWNAWQQKAADSKTIGVPSQIQFEVDPAIKDSPIVDAKKMPYSRTDMPAPGVKNDKAAAQGNNPTVNGKTPATGFDASKMTFNIAAGSSLTDVINLVMRNSDYIKKQVVDPLSDKTTLPEEKEIDYYKIIPKVELLDFDEKRNDYAKRTTFYVKKYSYLNTKHPNMPKAKPKGAVKHYNYIYTGKNIDIIEFSMDFDTAFYTTAVVNREKTEATSSAIGASDGEPGKDEIKKKPAGAGSVTPTVMHPIAGDATATATGADTAKDVLVASAMKSVTSSSRGDMLNVKLKILGDPHFIKQDDIYANPGHSDYRDGMMMITPGTLNMDRGELFCRIEFRTPVDMNDATGLTRVDPRFSNAGFSGYYRILSVESEFSKGQFVQTLDCIRTFDLQDPQTAERKEHVANQVQEDIDDRTVESDDEEDYSPSEVDVEEYMDNHPDDDEDFDTPDDESGNDEEEDPEEIDAEQEGQSINDDLTDAPEVEIDAAPAPVNTEVDYLIKKNDNLTKIATTYGTTVDYLMLINPQITDKNLIYTGQYMKVPSSPTN